MWHINLSTFYKTFWQEVTKMELYWILLSFARKRAPFNIQIKLTNFVKLLNCLRLKSSKNGLFRQWENWIFVSVCDTRWGYWKKKFELERKLFDTEKPLIIWHVNKFCITSQLQDSLNPSTTPDKWCLKLKFRLVSRNMLIFTWLKFQEILKTLESQVWVNLGNSYRKWLLKTNQRRVGIKNKRNYRSA